MLNLKFLVKENRRVKSVLSYLYRLIFHNSFKCYGRNNIIHSNICGLFLSKCNIRIWGNDNQIVFTEGTGVSRFSDLKISIHGNKNIVKIGANSSGSSLRLCLENDNNQIILGENFDCGPNTELAAIEGTSILFGDDCMLSANITIRTGDSHSVTNLEGKRINQSKSIQFGNHVWIGNTVIILKASRIGSNSVIGGGSVVTGKVFPDHCVIGGNPAKVLKEGVNWKRERI